MIAQSPEACEGCPRRPPEAAQLRFMARIVRLSNLMEIGVRFGLNELNDDEAEALTELRILQATPARKE